MKRLYTRQTRLIAAVLLGMLLAGGFWATPSLRALAQSVIEFFSPRTTDTQAGSVFAGGGEPPPQSSNPYPLSLDELTALADFDVRVPSFMPEQYHFGGGSYRSAMHDVEMIFYCPIAPWSLMIVQRQIDEPEPPMEVGASAIVEDVTIGDTIGQYVRGMWETRVDPQLIPTPGGEVKELPSTRIWTNDSAWQRIVWREDGINLMISTGSGTMGGDTPPLCALTKADYVAIAQHMQPASALAP